MDENVFKTHRSLHRCPPALLAYIIYRRLKEQGSRATWLWFKDKVKRRTLGFSPPEISRVTPHVYVGGQHKQRGLDAMRKHGITALLNMREEADDAERGVLLDDYLWLPTTDDAPPSLEDLERGVDFIETHAATGNGVYIHCASGVGRAPTMAAAYLVRQGATPQEAWEKIRAGRPFVRPTPLQVEVIRTFAMQEEHMAENTPQSQVSRKPEPAAASSTLGSTSGTTPLSGPDLQQRAQIAYERIAEDPNLTGALTDDAAHVLLRWSEDRIQRMVLETTGQDDERAQDVLDPKLRALRREVREMANAAADASDPVAQIQELIRTHPTSKS